MKHNVYSFMMNYYSFYVLNKVCICVCMVVTNWFYFEKINKDNFVVGIDTANGATSVVAEKVFKALGIKYKIIIYLWGR